MPLFLALVALAVILCFLLHGLNIAAKRFNGLGWGLALAALLVFWPLIHVLA